ncbi:transcriptional regulator [Desulfovibrio sp. OttesenSCG-928-C14]|nr:transcriptional regulator [Desulfovibrio sp. OttesenSCG-928-C14]
MLKFLLLAVGIFVVYKLFSNDFIRKNKDSEKKQAKETAQKAASGELVKDPVCGTYVSAQDSISVKDGDTVHRFCSYDCRDAFLKQLEKSGREIPEKTSDEDD